MSDSNYEPKLRFGVMSHEAFPMDSVYRFRRFDGRNWCVTRDDDADDRDVVRTRLYYAEAVDCAAELNERIPHDYPLSMDIINHVCDCVLRHRGGYTT